MDANDKKDRRTGHVKSALFRLPGEVRNKIYEETFAGSEIALVIDPPVDVQVVPVGGRRSIFTAGIAQHQFLLTCVQAYLEAIVIYWSQTIVRNGCDGHFSRGYFLNRIPDIAKRHIQHLRDVPIETNPNLRKLRGEWVRDPLSFAAALDPFTNLKTLSIKDRKNQLNRWYCLGIMEEAKAKRPKAQFFTKHAEPQLDEQGHWLYDRGLLAYVVTYRNYTTGSSCTLSLMRGLQGTDIFDEMTFEKIVDHNFADAKDGGD
ncbi:hypothetical protein N8I77_000271 [Diaporthe amygdali]|uniref:Uncharacterized protein n=1 Tax=Phomopsis amygdali TaxID=1214568 RepID=A0AAD9W876_PHOAM|nr:hypothetical protein N8I77_000271 [Diaporthe amygdali]